MEFSHYKLNAYLVGPTEYASLDSNSPEITLHIDNFNFPLTTSRRNSLYFAHLPEDSETPSDLVKRLTFRHVGSEDAPDVSRYSETCNSIEFDGHISSTNAVFGIISQLANLETVTFSIGMLQEQYCVEDYSRSYVCPSVKSLKIEMDLVFFHGYRDFDCDDENQMSSMQCSLMSLVKSLLIRARESFPNLKNIVLVLPKHESIHEAVRSLVRASHGLTEETLAKVREVLSVGVIYEVNEDGSHWEETHFKAGLDITHFGMDMDCSPDLNPDEEEALALIRGQ